MKAILTKLYKINKLLWLALILALPVTSFPFFPFPGMGGAVVRPLSLYPLLVLMLTLVLLSMFSGESLPAVISPLIAFIIAAVISTILVYSEPLNSLRGQTTTSRAVRDFATLVFGASYYLITILMIRDRHSLTKTVRVLYITFLIVAVYSTIQASMLRLGIPEFSWLNRIHRLISVRDLNHVRVHGFAYEPSWFASQLNILAIPMLFAGRMSGVRVLGRSRAASILEWILLAVLVFMQGLSYSRGGVVIGGIVLVTGLVLSAVLFLVKRKVMESTRLDIDRESGNKWKKVLRVFLVLALVVSFSVVLISQLSRYDYFTLIWEKLAESSNPMDYLMSIGGRPRLAFIQSGFRVFLEHPFLGVGLGQSGFYMLDAMPNWVYLNTNEVIELLNPYSPLFPNPKNLWVSLLAETGVIGTSLFVLFILNVFVQGLKYFKLQNRFGRFMGMYSVLSFLAILLSSYTLDSFATPNMWIAFGIMSAPAWPGFWETAEDQP